MAEFIDSKVIIPGQSRGYGILKYVGPIEGKSGTFGGIELQGPVAASRGKNSGAVDGIQYFQVSQPMSGLFLPWERLRSVNAKLPKLDDTASRTSSIASGEILQTPSPPTRYGLRFSSLSRQEPLSLNSGRESPYLPNMGINISKRGSSIKSSKPPGSAGSSTGSRSDLGEAFTRTQQQNTDVVALRTELISTKDALELSAHELREKNEILLELQRTVDELNPILGDYENSLMEKDRKLQKQRQEYDRAREEWRQSLDLMLSAQQQAESLYEQQIEDLKEEIAKAAHQGTSSESNSQVFELESRLQNLLAENTLLKEQIDRGQSANAEEPDQELIELLEKKIDRLTQDVTSIEIVLQQSQQLNRAKDVRIAELEIQLDELKEENVNSILEKVDSLSVHDWKEQEASYRRQIEELEKQIADQVGKENHVEHPKNHGLLEKLSALEADLGTSKKLVDTQSKKIDELEKNIEASVAREKELDEQTKSIESKNSSEELLKTIEDLKHELDMRPSFDELTELQNSLDDVERLHRNEIYLKEKEMSSLQEEYAKLQKEKDTLSNKIVQLGTENVLATPKHLSPVKNGTSTGSASLPDPEIWAKNDGLAVYTPPNPSDPSSGRSNWCGLCERDGHNSLNCPYENDIF